MTHIRSPFTPYMLSIHSLYGTPISFEIPSNTTVRVLNLCGTSTACPWLQRSSPTYKFSFLYLSVFSISISQFLSTLLSGSFSCLVNSMLPLLLPTFPCCCVMELISTSSPSEWEDSFAYFEFSSLPNAASSSILTTLNLPPRAYMNSEVQCHTY